MLKDNKAGAVTTKAKVYIFSEADIEDLLKLIK